MKIQLLALSALVALLVGAAPSWAQQPKGSSANLAATPPDVYAELYEHLANSIIEVRATEDNLVKGLLVLYHAEAQRRLAEAAEKSGERVAHVEAAAENIANIANEGDKRVRAVRQRLQEAGHYHQKDTETAEDYLFINSAEKKSLLAIARKVGQLRTDAQPAEIRKASDELKAVFGKAIGRD
jgi:hypothetical protein